MVNSAAAELIDIYVAGARKLLVEAMKVADEHGATEEHRQVSERVLSVDDLQTWLSDRTEGQ